MIQEYTVHWRSGKITGTTICTVATDRSHPEALDLVRTAFVNKLPGHIIISIGKVLDFTLNRENQRWEPSALVVS